MAAEPPAWRSRIFGPVSVPDLLATFCKSRGLKADKENMTSVGRPIKVVDGGKPVDELFG